MRIQTLIALPLILSAFSVNAEDAQDRNGRKDCKHPGSIEKKVKCLEDQITELSVKLSNVQNDYVHNGSKITLTGAQVGECVIVFDTHDSTASNVRAAPCAAENGKWAIMQVTTK